MNQLTLDPQPQEQSYRTIPLTQGQVTTVDIGDFDWLNQWKWCALWSKHGKCFYAARTSVSATGRRGTIRMHRFILDLSGKTEGDHKNGDTLDNRRFNLRPANHQQNSRNRKHRIDNQSGFRGVYSDGIAWRAQIRISGKLKSLGRFGSAESASAAYENERRQTYGEFIREGAK